ncbi:MAG TPA: diacylglycerol kinase family lipid kinase, partial [Firmicutes bacterium]|nr:diacylglycerol kinase family lipid kinase [Bacillota bacterium]
MKSQHSAINLPYETAFIVNPAAGGGHAGRIWPHIEDTLKGAALDCPVYFSRSRGEARELALRAVKRGAELVVAAGGDGTVNEVVNGIDLEKTIMGIIPLGTGNGFRRACGIPGGWQEPLLGLGRWLPRAVDVGTVNGRRFLNVVGIGFDAAVAEMAAEKYGRLKGYLPYVAAFFKELIQFGHFSVSIECDNQIFKEQETLLVAIANGSNYGGRVSIAPRARIDDGQLDLILVHKGNNTGITYLAAKVLLKKHLADGAIFTGRARKFVVEADRPVPVHTDGEVTGRL